MDQYSLSALTVVLLVSLVIPVATGIVTKLNAPATVKQIVALVFATANGLITTATMSDGTAVISKETLIVTLIGFGIQTATYLGIYAPHNANAKLAPNAGIGPSA